MTIAMTSALTTRLIERNVGFFLKASIRPLLSARRLLPDQPH